MCIHTFSGFLTHVPTGIFVIFGKHNSRFRTCAELISCYIYLQVASLLKPNIDPLFYNSKPKKTTPNCGISVKGEYNPEVCFHGYEVNLDCKISAYHTLPFFMDNFGPKYTEYTTTSHEQLPGHHLEVSVDGCGGWVLYIGTVLKHIKYI